MKLKEVTQRIFFVWWFGLFFMFMVILYGGAQSIDQQTFLDYGIPWLYTWFVIVGLIYGALRLLSLFFDLVIDIGRVIRLASASPEKAKRDAALAAAPVVIEYPDLRTLPDQEALAWLALSNPERKGTTLLQRLQTKETR